MGFTIRQLTPEDASVGSLLKLMRRNLHLSLTDIVARTKIQRPYLEALEADAYEKLPEPLYVRHFIKTYVRTLNENPDYILSRYEAERQACDLSEAMRLPRQKIQLGRFFSLHTLAKIAGGSLVSGLIVFYVVHQVVGIVRPPSVAIFEPRDGSTTDNGMVTIRGQAEKETTILVNQIPVLPKQDGSFSTDIVLDRGLNTIVVEGTKRHSKSTTLYRRVLFESDAPAYLGISGTPEGPVYP